MSLVTQFGESFVGEGVDAAHVNTVLGAVGGPIETAWVTALATPRAGFAAFVAVVEPGIAVRPFTLFVNKAAIDGERHGALTWGAAQAGVAGGVLDAVAEGIIEPSSAADALLIAAVWVNPDADDEDAVYRNNRAATLGALRAWPCRGVRCGRSAAGGAPGAPWNAFFRSTPS